MANDTADQLKRTAALRAEVAQLDRDDVRAQASRTWLGRRLRLASTVLTLALVGVLAVDGWLAFDAFLREPDAKAPASTEPTYRDLEVFEKDGRFAGRITLVNPLDEDVELIVEVDMYDGEQNVGDLLGTMTLKPDSESVLELDGYDKFVEFNDARVDLSGWPK